MVPWEELQGKTVAISGVTGLVGSLLLRALAYKNEHSGLGMRVIGLARHPENVINRSGAKSGVSVAKWDALDEHEPDIDAVDFVIHCASITKSSWFIEKPVETINTTVKGTESLLQFAAAKGSRFCYVSSMEVYGEGSSKPLTEEAGGALNSMNLRSSYPQAKQLAEALTAAYASEYGVQACVARLAQTFGAGVPSSDGRVFAQFVRACLSGDNIHLLTDGSKQNMYVSTVDAVTALLLLVVRGENGQAYNVANEQTLCSIRDMAQMVSSRFGEGRVEVVFDSNPGQAKKYPKSGVIRMDTAKLQLLGWAPTVSLSEMYHQLIQDWGNE
jgi:nucleoside-diphosphate-sugar epimerase